MKDLAGFIQHIWLLLTYRHTGKGLTTTLSASIFIFSLYLVTKVIRWCFFAESGIIGVLLISILFFILFFKFFGSEKTNAFYLIGLGTNVFGILLGGATQDIFDIIIFVWSISAALVVWGKMK